MLFVLASLAAAADEALSSGRATPVLEISAPPADLLDEAHRRSTRGAALVTTGGVAVGGGLAVLLIREGGPDKVIEEGTPTLIADLRSVGGAVLVMGGLVALYTGADELGRAAGLRERARGVTVVPTTRGVLISGRF